MSEANKTELTVEEKKAAAAAAKLEAKNKADAERKDKADNKAKEVETTVSTLFVTVQENVNTGKSVIAGLTETSTVDEVKSAGESAANYLKSAKGGLKDIKAAVRKVTDADERGLSQAVTTGDTLVAELDSMLKSIKEKVTSAKAADREAEKQRKAAERAEAKAANAQPQANGVTRPRPDTACGKAWELFDELSGKLKQPVPISIALQAADKKGLVFDTVKTQYARWKKFNGIEGRVAMPIPEGIL